MVILLCSSGMLYKNSGIYTFINNTINLFSQLGEEILLYTDATHSNSDFNVIKDYQHLASVCENNIVIANDYISLMWVKDVVSIAKSCYYYTHIGDMFHNNVEFYDFEQSETDEAIEIIKSKKIKILCQTSQIKNGLITMFEDADIYVAGEPLIEMNNDITIPKIKNTALCIMSNLKRKRIDDVVKLCEKLNYNLILITSGQHGYYDLNNMIKNSRIEIKVFSNIDNIYMPLYYSMCDFLIHFSEIEVLPYSIMEALKYIPVFINNDAYWSNFISDEYVHKIDKNDFQYILNNLDKFKNFDYNKYVEETKKQWIQIIKTEE